MCSSNEVGGVTGIILISKFQKKEINAFFKIKK